MEEFSPGAAPVVRADPGLMKVCQLSSDVLGLSECLGQNNQVLKHEQFREGFLECLREMTASAITISLWWTRCTNYWLLLSVWRAL